MTTRVPRAQAEGDPGGGPAGRGGRVEAVGGGGGPAAAGDAELGGDGGGVDAGRAG
ncbi:hypothetical protein ACFUJU_23540 [Streptomyces sp. NPDC057235]|uniref:hypothetical protein n=1 Tax=Streptomyces sp. NPDC057235 TaxID=3346058 RepID=UPI00363DB117